MATDASRVVHTFLPEHMSQPILKEMIALFRVARAAFWHGITKNSYTDNTDLNDQNKVLWCILSSYRADNGKCFLGIPTSVSPSACGFRLGSPVIGVTSS